MKIILLVSGHWTYWTFSYGSAIRMLFEKIECKAIMKALLSECYSKKIEYKAIMITLNYKIAPKTLRRFVDDSHASFQESSLAVKFLEIL